MQFDAKAYSSGVAEILALDQHGHRLIPLVSTGCSSEEARTRLRKQRASDLFPKALSPKAALGGLWLYFSCWDECHEIVQNVHTSEGSVWHGIAHRQEPDPVNATYWFRQAGSHPVFPDLFATAQSIRPQHILPQHGGAGLKLTGKWDPFAFIDFCESARQDPGSPAEWAALEIQRAEWQLVFDYCARPRS